MLRHPERERSPTASEFEDLLAILELRPLAGEGQHRLLGLREGGVLGGPVTAAVLEARPENLKIKLRRHLVVLFVRIRGVNGDGRGIKPRAERGKPGIALLKVTPSLFAHFFGKEMPDAATDQGVGNKAGGEKGVESAHERLR